MKLGHIQLARRRIEANNRLLLIAENLDHLGIRQHFVVADDASARYLQRFPFVLDVNVTSSPIVANCLMSSVDVVHAHDYRAGRAGLIMTLTRGIPFVLTAEAKGLDDTAPLWRSVRRRAKALIDHNSVSVSALVELYAEAIRRDSELPEDADCG